ncbi:MAG: isoprenylcysteine carboxylmethyltransferase family protein, partial [Alteromonas sp.]
MTRLFLPSIDTALGMFTSSAQIIAWVGFAMLSIGFAMAIVTHHQMHDHWRSGIDDGYQGALVTTGLFA